MTATHSRLYVFRRKFPIYRHLYLIYYIKINRSNLPDEYVGLRRVWQKEKAVSLKEVSCPHINSRFCQPILACQKCLLVPWNESKSSARAAAVGDYQPARVEGIDHLVKSWV